MKALLWIVLIIAGAAVAGRLLGIGIGHGIGATSEPPPAAAAAAASPAPHGPWEDYQRAPEPTDDQIAKINADLARKRQVEEDAKVQARAMADELRR